MKASLVQIYKGFKGKLVGTERMKQYVCIVVSHLPKDLQKYVMEYCWFLGSMDDAWAYTFTGNDLEDQHMIFLSDDLLGQHQHQVEWSIAHEIGHVVLGHKNNIFIKQSKYRVNKQEEEADAFAAQFV